MCHQCTQVKDYAEAEKIVLNNASVCNVEQKVISHC